jgi:hypothetical protein
MIWDAAGLYAELGRWRTRLEGRRGGRRKAGVRRGVLRLDLRESKGKTRFLTLL